MTSVSGSSGKQASLSKHSEQISTTWCGWDLKRR
jgi:hypothetical protein